MVAGQPSWKLLLVDYQRLHKSQAATTIFLHKHHCPCCGDRHYNLQTWLGTLLVMLDTNLRLLSSSSASVATPRSSGYHRYLRPKLRTPAIEAWSSCEAVPTFGCSSCGCGMRGSSEIAFSIFASVCIDIRLNCARISLALDVRPRITIS